MSKQYKYVRLDDIEKYDGWEVVEILQAKFENKCSMAVMCREKIPKSNNVISELHARLCAYYTGINIKGEELIIIPKSDYNQILKEVEAMFNDR